MGTDIHMVIEARKDGKVWERVDIKRPCTWCSGTGVDPNAKGEAKRCYFCQRNPGFQARGGAFDERDYDVFAILADVRNGKGFAGVDTGDGFIPIAQPRGLPDDLAKPNKDTAEDDLGDHSFSWLTLAELNAYPHWEKSTTKKRGVVYAKDFADWDSTGRGEPQNYCGDVDGMSIFKVSNSTLRILIKDGLLDQLAQKELFNRKREAMGNVPMALPQFVTQVEWGTDYKNAAGNFYAKFLPALKSFAVKECIPDENVRIVFGFDS